MKAIGITSDTCASGLAKALPATGAQTIFTITGGPILLVALVGIVTTAIQNQACTAVWNSIDTLSSTTKALTGTTTLTNLLIGEVIVIPAATLATAGLIATGGVVEQTVSDMVTIPAGIINYVTSATNTGAIQWYMRYEPLSPTTVVVAN